MAMYKNTPYQRWLKILSYLKKAVEQTTALNPDAYEAFKGTLVALADTVAMKFPCNHIEEQEAHKIAYSFNSVQYLVKDRDSRYLESKKGLKSQLSAFNNLKHILNTLLQLTDKDKEPACYRRVFVLLQVVKFGVLQTKCKLLPYVVHKADKAHFELLTETL